MIRRIAAKGAQAGSSGPLPIPTIVYVLFSAASGLK
jgi:hypothetical protein